MRLDDFPSTQTLQAPPGPEIARPPLCKSPGAGRCCLLHMLSPGPRAGVGVGAPDGRGGCSCPRKGRVWAADREQAASAWSSRSGRRTAASPPPPTPRPRTREEGRTAPGRRHNLCSEGERQLFSHFWRLLSAKPHTREQKSSQSLQPRGPPCFNSTTCPFPKSQSHPPSKTGFRGLAFEEQACRLGDSPSQA